MWEDDESQSRVSLLRPWACHYQTADTTSRCLKAGLSSVAYCFAQLLGLILWRYGTEYFKSDSKSAPWSYLRAYRSILLGKLVGRRGNTGDFLALSVPHKTCLNFCSQRLAAQLWMGLSTAASSESLWWARCTANHCWIAFLVPPIAAACRRSCWAARLRMVWTNE